jgi:hypothetical protein
MGRERIQTRADGDTVDQIENYREDHDVSNSEAMRRLIRRGLEAEGYRGETDDEIPDGYAKAGISQTARIIGGTMIGVALTLLLFAEVGVI